MHLSVLAFVLSQLRIKEKISRTRFLGILISGGRREVVLVKYCLSTGSLLEIRDQIWNLLNHPS